MRLFTTSTKEKLEHKLIALALFIGVVIVNALATLLPINGKTTGAISDSYPNLFAPAGVTFAIWSVIYLLLWVYVVYQFKTVRDTTSTVKESELESLNQYFIVSSLLNIVWIFSWHYEVIWLSVIIMLGLLVTLIKANVLLQNVKMSTADKWAIKAPFSVYFGWITVATVANITTWLVSIQWDRFGQRPGIWMVGVLLVTAVIAIAVVYKMKDWLYGTVIVWAFAGILLKHLSSEGWDGQYPSVIVTLTILLAVLIVTVLYTAEKDLVESR